MAKGGAERGVWLCPGGAPDCPRGEAVPRKDSSVSFAQPEGWGWETDSKWGSGMRCGKVELVLFGFLSHCVSPSRAPARQRRPGPSRVTGFRVLHGEPGPGKSPPPPSPGLQLIDELHLGVQSHRAHAYKAP